MGMYTDYPAKYKEVISVSSINKAKQILKYAEQGKVDFVPPGEDINAVKIQMSESK